MLLERAPLSVPRALERMGGLQNQYAPAGYVGLWTRLRDFERAALTRALEQRTVVQATLMRVTIHLVSARDYWPLTEAVREARRVNFLRTFKADRLELERAAERVRQVLAGGPRKAVEVDGVVGADRVLRYGVALWVDLVRVPPSGTWERRRADLLATAEQHLGPSNATAEEGMDLLVRRYLGAFGPAGARDIATWGGVGLPAVREAISRIRLRAYRDEDGAELVDLPGQTIPQPDAPAPVRFLPVWDASLLVHARRARLLAEEHRPLVFNTKTPHSVGTFLVDGSVAGTWRLVKGRVTPEPFGALAPAVRNEVAEEADRLSEFHA